MSVDKRFYVYMLIDPKTDLPFYVGKGTGNRCHHHFNSAYPNSNNKFKNRKIQKLLKENFSKNQIIKIFKNKIDNTEAVKLESELIKKYGRKGIDKNGILSNRCLDDNPPDQAGVHKSDEWKRQQSIRQIGQNNSFYGKKHSIESKQKMSASSKKRWTEEERKKCSERNSGQNNPMSGRIHSEETKKLIGLKSKGRIPWNKGRKLK